MFVPLFLFRLVSQRRRTAMTLIRLESLGQDLARSVLLVRLF